VPGCATGSLADVVRNEPAGPAEHAAWREHGRSYLGTPAATARSRSTVGDVTVVGVADGEFRMRRDFACDNVPSAAMGLTGPNAEVSLPIGAFLVLADEVVLMDTGFGPLHVDTLTGGNLLVRLHEQGLAPEDVDVVLISHLHADHTGWLGHIDGTPVFPNARVVINGVEWHHLLSGNGGRRWFGHTVAAVQKLEKRGHLELVSGTVQVTPEITAVELPGHTPGHTAFRIAAQGEVAYYVGDAVHLPIQLAHPEWGTTVDNDPASARRSRERLIEFAEESRAQVLSPHFPGLRPIMLASEIRE
jgi:glyoxylase-like metal-dependent hydrolase (beta-lactamase superfamily II)